MRIGFSESSLTRFPTRRESYSEPTVAKVMRVPLREYGSSINPLNKFFIYFLLFPFSFFTLFFIITLPSTVLSFSSFLFSIFSILSPHRYNFSFSALGRHLLDPIVELVHALPQYPQTTPFVFLFLLTLLPFLLILTFTPKIEHSCRQELLKYRFFNRTEKINLSRYVIDATIMNRTIFRSFVVCIY